MTEYKKALEYSMVYTNCTWPEPCDRCTLMNAIRQAEEMLKEAEKEMQYYANVWPEPNAPVYTKRAVYWLQKRKEMK